MDTFESQTSHKINIHDKAISKVCIFGGAGYVGLITGVGLAALGHKVVCVDINSERISLLQEGRSPLHEEGMEQLLNSLLETDAIRFTTDSASAIQDADIVLIAVGTPSTEDGQANITQAISVTKDIVASMKSYKVIAVKSTIPLDGFDAINTILNKHLHEGVDFDIAYTPEFLREGRGLEDFFAPSRIVVGSSSGHAMQAIRNLYRPIIEKEHDLCAYYAPTTKDRVPYIETSVKTAQIIKYAANAFLSTRISFANELSELCEVADANLGTVISALSLDPRIGTGYMQSGLGFGGPCLEKDLIALIHMAESLGCSSPVFKGVLERNRLQPKRLMSVVHEVMSEGLCKQTVAIFGLAFKEGTNDARNSPALVLARLLMDKDASVKGYDPLAVRDAQAIMPDIVCHEDPLEAASGADALIITNADSTIARLDYRRVLEYMNGNILIDAPAILDGEQMKAFGFNYRAIGLSNT